MPYTSKILTEPIFGMQRGSTCGLYALEGVIRVLKPSSPYHATRDKHHRVDSKGQPTTKKEHSLRHIAKNKLNPPVTVIGELFNADDLGRLANHIGLSAKVLHKPNWSDVIKASINSGKYVIAPFGVNPATGQPQTMGDKAHFCVIFGYAFWSGPPKKGVKKPGFPTEEDYPQRSYAVVRHWDKRRCFYIETFGASSRALKEFPEQYWAKKSGSKSLSYAKATPSTLGARKIPKADLPNTLAGKLIVVGK